MGFDRETRALSQLLNFYLLFDAYALGEGCGGEKC